MGEGMGLKVAPGRSSEVFPSNTFPLLDGDLSLPLGLALGSPIFPSGCEGKMGVALKSLQGRKDEALVPSRDSRARTRSPSPRAWRPDFPGAAREAP